MVRSSPRPDIKQVYNCEANDVGPGRIVYALVYKRLLTNRLYGKAAEWAMFTTRLTGIEYIYGKVELEKPSLFNG